jgi:hypothetical protein
MAVEVLVEADFQEVVVFQGESAEALVEEGPVEAGRMSRS